MSPSPGESRVRPVAPGARLGDHTLIRVLGAGAVGTVYLARTDQGAEHAVKVIAFPSGERGARIRERFLREGTALAKVDRHPAIVRIHDCKVDDARRCGYHVLEYVEGTDLARLLAEGLLPLPRALEIAEQVAGALAHVHAAGIVHRDLKPANVLIRADGRPVLTDFGVARDESDDRLTQSGALVGTPHHMSPEQAGGHRDATGPWSDVFCLGILLYELVTGSPPFFGDRPLEILAQIAVANPPPPSRLRAGIPRDLDLILSRALAKSPDARPSASEIAEALARLQRGEPIGWSHPSAARTFAARVRGRDPRALAGLLGGVLVPALLCGAWFGWLAPSQQGRAFLAEHGGWEQRVLEPWALGARAIAPELEEVDRRLARLREARAALGPTDGLDRRLDRLEAARRLLTTEPAPVPSRPSGRSAAQLTVDARLLLRSDELFKAQRRVQRALALAPDSVAAQLLLYEIEAADDPLGFLRRAGELAGTAPQVMARAAATVGQKAYLDAVRAGPAGAADVMEVARALQALGLSPAGLAAAKQDALEQATSAWCQGLRDAVRSRDEPRWAASLGRVTRAPPLVHLGPALNAAIDETLEDLFYGQYSDMRSEDRIRPILVEQALFYEADLERRATDALRGALVDLSLIRKVNLTRSQKGAVALACVRAEPPILLSTVAKWVDSRGWQFLIKHRPESRGARLGAVMRLCEDAGFGDLERAQAAVEAFGDALDPRLDLVNDVSPQSLGVALHWLTRARGAWISSEGIDPEVQRIQLRALRSECQRARALLTGQLRTYADNLAVEGAAVAHVEGPRAALELLDAEIPAALRLAKRGLWPGTPEPGERHGRVDVTGNPLGEVATLEIQRAQLHLRLQQPEQAIQRARTAIGMVTQDVSLSVGGPDRHLEFRALVAEILLLLNRPAEARAELEPHRGSGLGVPAFVLQYVPLLVASGEADEAHDYLRQARERNPEDRYLKQLEAQLQARE